MAERIPSIEVISRAKLEGMRVAFNKISIDGSGKGNLVDEPDGEVWGVLYKVSDEEISSLDEIEVGYQRVQITVIDEEQNSRSAFTYISSNTDERLVPFDWYLDLVIEGAQEHQLPQEYIDTIICLPTKLDKKIK